MGETTPQITGLGRKWYNPKAFYDREGTKVLYMSPNEGDKFFRTPYNNISGLSPDSARGEFIPPVITGPSGSAGDLITAISINENSTPIHIFSADETVTWSKSGADTSKFTLNTSTGELVFASAPNYEVPTDADGNNIYQVVITATDAAGNSSSQTVNVTVSDIDENPVLNSSTPADNATGVAVNSNIVLNFNKAVDAESGNIYIKKTSDNSTVQTIDVTSGAVSGSGSATITINPPSDLDNGVEYYVLIDATAFDAADSSSYAGISSTTALSFTTLTYVTSDLVLHYDAADTNSYSGSGTTWFDLSGNDYDTSIVSGNSFPTFDSNGYFTYNKSMNVLSLPDNATLNESDHAKKTLSVWFKTPSSFDASASRGIFCIGGAQANYVIYIQDNDLYMGARSAGSGNNWTTPTGATTALTASTWYNATMVLDAEDNTTLQDNVLKLYVNGSSIGTAQGHRMRSISNPGTIGGGLLVDVKTNGNLYGRSVHGDGLMESDDDASSAYDGFISIAMVYNKALSSSEVTQNFNTFKSRYGY